MNPSRNAFLAAFVLVAVACSGGGTQTQDQPNEKEPQNEAPVEQKDPSGSLKVAKGPFARVACRLPEDQIFAVWAGYTPGRGGELQFVPKFPNQIGTWWAHSGPWPYLQRVPLFLYGPGHVAPVGRVAEPATVADMAPTYGALLGYDYEAVDGRVLEEAVAGSEKPPRLILHVVWDAAGRNVLSAYPDAWPEVKSRIDDGAWYENATVGSSPSVTPATHTTMGTGALPRHHGILDLRFQVDGELVPPVTLGPKWYLTHTLADEYDVAMGNEPQIGLIASEATLGMIGHGAGYEGGDKDFALAQRGGVWQLKGPNHDFFEFPEEYANRDFGLKKAVEELDAADGARDNAWMGEEMFDDPDDLTHTPAYARYQNNLTRHVIRTEGFGQDEVPDLLYVNYKQVDKVGHKWSFPTPFMEQALASSDWAFGNLVQMLDKEVGEGEWVLAVTADHGATPLIDVMGGWQIDNKKLVDDLLAEFDNDGDDKRVLQSMRVTQAWIDEAELKENGFTIEQVARWMMSYTRGDNAADPSTLTPEERNEKAFSVAFPGSVLDGTLPCIKHRTG